MKNGRGYVTSIFYDRYGYLTRTTDPEGNTAIALNDYAGRPALAIDAENKETRNNFDQNDNPTSLVNHLNYQVSLNYNDNGMLNAVSWINKGVISSTNYTYDSEDRLKSVINPLGLTASYTYDGYGNLDTRRDYAGNTTTYGYD